MAPNSSGYALTEPNFSRRNHSIDDLTALLVTTTNGIRRQRRPPRRFSHARLGVDVDESTLSLTKPELFVFFGVLLFDVVAGCYMYIVGRKDTSESICNSRLASALRSGGLCALVQAVCMVLAEWLRQLPQHCSNRQVRESCYSLRCFLVLVAMAVVLPLFWATSVAVDTVVTYRMHSPQEKLEHLCDQIFVYSPILLAVPLSISCLIVIASCN